MGRAQLLGHGQAHAAGCAGEDGELCHRCVAFSCVLLFFVAVIARSVSDAAIKGLLRYARNDSSSQLPLNWDLTPLNG